MHHDRLLRFATSLVTVLLMASSGRAQQISGAPVNTSVVPHLVSYSGTLKDVSGKPITGITGVTFLLYRDQQGGAPVWMETQNVTPDHAGRYSAQLGATRSEGLPPETFMTGEARWLAVQVAGAPEQPRVLLVAVPYAMKALDAETVGGLPPSAFMLAVPPRSGAAGTSVDVASSNPVPGAPPPASTVTTSGGTVNALPLWTTATNVQSSAITQTGSGATAKIGIGTTAPAAVLDVKGSEYVRGALTLPATGNATATAGKNSQPQDFIASSFSNVISTAVNQKFQWQAEPAANDTANPSGTLNLLYGLGATTPAETGLKLSNKGIFTFAAGQTFPGTGSGTVTSVGLSAPASDFTIGSSPVTTRGTIALNWSVAPTSGDIANAIVKRDANGSFSAGAIGASLGVTSLSPGIAVYGETSGGGGGADGVHGVAHGAGSGVTGVSDNNNGVGVWAQGPGYALYANGNTGQGRGYGGMVKAMVQVGEGNSIFGCFNSTLAGPAATTPPCGFATSFDSQLGVTVDFGFEVDDRFYSATLVRCLCGTNIPVLFATPTGTTTVRVGVYVGGSGTSSQIASIWHLIVY